MGARKIKPVKKPQKKQVVPEDTAFERVKAWADENYTTIVGACVVVLLAAAIFWAYNAHSHSKQAKARSDYGVLLAKLPDETKATQADWEKLIPDLKKFISEHEGTAPALDARIELAKALFEAKQYGEAVTAGQEALAMAGAGSSLRPLIQYQLAYAYEAAGKLDEAASEWTELKQLGSHDFDREADWNLGRIFEGRKDFGKAAEMYQLASQTPGDYPPGSLIDQRMAGVKAMNPGAKAAAP